MADEPVYTKAETDLGTLWCHLLTVIAPEARGRGIELMTQIATGYGVAMKNSELRGLEQGRAESADAAYKRGHDDGWASCVNEIAGMKAARVLEDAAESGTLGQC